MISSNLMRKHAMGLASLGLVIGALVLSPAPGTAALAPAGSISLGTTIIGEGDDFATRVIGLLWDMSAGPYPDFPTVFDNVDRASFLAAGGLWSFTTTNNDPNVWLLWPNIENTQHVLRMGDRFPIDAAKYKLLSFRLCSNLSDSLNVYWYNAPLAYPPNLSGVSHYIPMSPGCKVYAVDLTQIGTFPPSLSWSGSLAGLRLDSGATNSSLSLQLDWARLTTVDTSNVVPINWSSVTSGSTLYFYLNSTCSAAGATLVGTTARNGNSSGTFHWGSVLQPNPTAATPLPIPESFQPGPYTVFLLVDNVGDPICAGASLQVHKAPVLSFQRPSFFSGPDYATEVIGDPWGMSNSQDIGTASGIASSNFTDGTYNATTDASGDPQLYLNFASPIDTSKYKYVTFRWYMEGLQDIGLGWVHRIFWWYAGPGIDSVTTEDMVIYEGWHTYSLDLSQALIDPSTPSGSWTGQPRVFRMDPHEMPLAASFHVDFVTLTGDERVTAGTPFRVIYQTTPAAGVNVTLYYDSDTNPANGRTLMVQYNPPAPAPSLHSLFLPLGMRSFNAEINLLTGTGWAWDTIGVPAGTYYVLADVNDGVMTTTWYSETPVIVGN